MQVAKTKGYGLTRILMGATSYMCPGGKVWKLKHVTCPGAAGQVSAWINDANLIGVCAISQGYWNGVAVAYRTVCMPLNDIKIPAGVQLVATDTSITWIVEEYDAL